MSMRLIVYSLTAIFLLGACTERGRPIHEHEPKAANSPAPDPTASETPSAGNAAADISNPLVLATQVLDPKRVRDPNSLSNESFRDQLIALNRAILDWPAERREEKQLTVLLENYARAVDLDCEELKSRCPGRRYFLLSGDSFAVLKLAAKKAPEARKPRLIFWAIELKNRQADNELLSLAVKHVTPAVAAADARLYATLGNFIETAIELAANSTTSPAEAKKFAGSIPLWNLLGEKSWKLGRPAQQKLWVMASRAGAFHAADGNLVPEFRRLMEEYDGLPHSLRSNEMELKAADGIHPEALGARFSQNRDELDFLMDAVYMQKLSAAEAAAIFGAGPRSSAELTSRLEAYSRLRFAWGLYKSSRVASKIFRADVETKNLMTYAVSQSSRVREIWGPMEAAFLYLKNFAELALKSREDGAPFLAEVSSRLGSFERTVNIASVYPHLLMLFHLMSQEDFDIELQSLSHLTAAKVMDLAFWGYFLPNLKYTSGTGVKLNTFELLYAFDFAVRSGSFQAMEIKPDDFMSDTLLRLTEETEALLNLNFERIDSRLRQAVGAEDFKQTCRALGDGHFAEKVLNLGELQLSSYFGGFIKNLTTAVSSLGGSGATLPGGKTSVNDMGVYYADIEFGEALERARLNLGQHLRTGEAMLRSYSHYLATYEGLSAPQIKARTRQTRKKLEQIRLLRETALAKARQWQEEIGRCYLKAQLKELEVHRELLRHEEAFLRQVHRDVRTFRSAPESVREGLREAYRLKNLEGGFPGLDEISENGYRVSQLNLLVRFKNYLGEIAPYIRVAMPSKFDSKQPLVTGVKTYLVPFLEDEDRFVQTALKTYFAKGDPFLQWLNISGRLLAWNQMLRTMAITQRLEVELKPNDVRATSDAMLDLHEDALALLRLTSEDRRLFEILRVDARFSLLTLDEKIVGFPMDPNTGVRRLQDTWGIYDLPMKMMNRQVLGSEYDDEDLDAVISPLYQPKRFGFMQLGQDYFNARSPQTRGPLVIDFNPRLDRFLDVSIANFVNREIRTTQGFHEALARRVGRAASLSPELRPRADVNVDVSIVSPWINPNLARSFEGDLKTFMQRTQNCYENLLCENFK